MKEQTTSLLRTPFASIVLTTLMVVALTTGAHRIYAQNDALKDITLADALTKDEMALSDFKNRKAIVLVFFCNNCPYSTFYVERIKNLASSYQNVQFVLVNSSNSDYVPEETETAMVSFIKSNGLGLPYLMDKDQKLKNIMGAKRCPESFIISPGDWKTVYRGAIDNNPQVAADVSENYLTNALDQVLLGGQVSPSSVRTSGCIIK